VNVEVTATLVRAGYSIVCATCDHMQRAHARGLDSCHQPCGGPLSGQSFPAYVGPITDFQRWCFVCGETSKYGVTVPGGSTAFGVCASHLDTLRAVRATKVPQAPSITAVQGDRGLVPIDRLLGKPLKSLAATISEVERARAAESE
jgi:hypothetical protein